MVDSKARGPYKGFFSDEGPAPSNSNYLDFLQSLIGKLQGKGKGTERLGTLLESLGYAAAGPGAGQGGESSSETETLQALAAPVAAEPTVSTNKLDYRPGETALITGAGFTPGSTVEISILETGDTDVDGPGPDDTRLDDYGTVATVEVKEDGTFQANWQVPEDPDTALGATLLLTATSSSNESASTSFTDAGFLVPGSGVVLGGMTAGPNLDDPSLDLTSRIDNDDKTFDSNDVTFKAGAYFTNDPIVADPSSSGTGVLSPFVQIGGANKSSVKGYNQYKPREFDAGSSDQFNLDLPIEVIPRSYYDLNNDGTPEELLTLRLDINQNDTNESRWLSLEDLEIWQIGTPPTTPPQHH
jgi:hypothetical protein